MEKNLLTQSSGRVSKRKESVVRVVHHQRQPFPGSVSIERLFDEVRAHLPDYFETELAICPRFSKGAYPRVINTLTAGKYSADIHHIVGDVHYLAFGLPPKKTVLTIHDCSILNRLTGWKLKFMRYFWYIGPMRRVANITTISDAIKVELQRKFGRLADKITVIPNCLRSEFKYTPKPFCLQRPVVLQVGTGWNKNLERVLQALQGTGGNHTFG